MLSGIHPLLTGRLLAALDAMGHSDALVVCDAHFPAARLARELVELPGATAPEVTAAVLSVLPLDPERPGALMDSGAEPAAVVDELRAACGPAGLALPSTERDDFYRLAAAAALVVRTGETRPFGNVLLRKGLVEPSPFPRFAPAPYRVPTRSVAG